MALRYKITPQAAQDLRDALDYYKALDRELPNYFMREYLATRKLICEFPNSYPVIVKSRRRAKFIGKFPYSIFYLTQKDTVIIVAILHHKRHPKNWKR
jgi:plasmid stabilization system protein ParE